MYVHEYKSEKAEYGGNHQYGFERWFLLHVCFIFNEGTKVTAFYRIVEIFSQITLLNV